MVTELELLLLEKGLIEFEQEMLLPQMFKRRFKTFAELFESFY